MPKIRGVKPDYWTDDDVTELTIPARLLFIGLWNFACDNGHLQDKSKQIKMRILPADDVNCADLLRELAVQRLITRDDGWITIPNLTHHQKPHKRWWVTCEKPGCELPNGASYGYSKPDSTVEQPLSNGGATVNNGCSTADVDCDVDCEVDGELMVMVTNPRPKGSESEPPEGFDAFWETYGKKVGRRNAEQKYRAAMKKPGITAALLVSAAASYVDFQRREGKHPQFTKDPATWLHGEHWGDERITQAPAPTRVQQHLALARQLAEEESAHPQIGTSR